MYNFDKTRIPNENIYILQKKTIHPRHWNNCHDVDTEQIYTSNIYKYDSYC